MIEIVAVIALALICIGQTVERYLYQKDMTNKLNDAIKAVMSRNINEYITATTTPKYKNDVQPKNEDIDLSEADDETFDKALKKM